MAQILHMPDRINLSVNRNTFNLVVNTFNTEGFISRRQRRTLPTDAFWAVSMTADQLSNIGHPNVAGWLDFEGFVNQVLMRSAFFTMFDAGVQHPMGTPLADITEGECLDFVGGQEFTDDKYSIEPVGQRATVSANGRKGELFVQITGLLESTRVLRTGDKFSIHHGVRRIPMLYQATQDIDSDINGTCTVNIAPGLRGNVVIGDAVSFYRPRSVFQFAEIPESARVEPYFARTYFEATEVPEVLDDPTVTI